MKLVRCTCGAWCHYSRVDSLGRRMVEAAPHACGTLVLLEDESFHELTEGGIYPRDLEKFRLHSCSGDRR